jgi:phage shock protein PspC (stress-responsive transcriptional regulator)
MDPDVPPNEPRPGATPEPPPSSVADTAEGDAGDILSGPAEATAGDEAPPPPPPPGAGSEPVGGGPWAPGFQILRSRHDRKLGGVAGGLAAATGLDPTLVRLVVVLGCLTGWGVLAYLIAWAVIPEEDPARGRYLVPAPERTARHLRIGLVVVAVLGVLHVVGAILGVLSTALIGLGLFPARIFGLSHRGFMPGEALLGLVLLIGGCLLLFRRHLPWLPAADGTSTGAWFSDRFGATGPASSGPGGSASSPSGAAAATTLTGNAGGGASTAGYGGTSGAGYGSTGSGEHGATPSGYGGSAGAYGPPPPPPAGPGFGARASAAARVARTNGPLLLVRAAGWLVALWFLAAAVVGGLFWLTGALHVHQPVLPIVTGVAALGFLGYTLIRSRRPAAVVGAMALLLVPTGLAAALTRVDGQAGHRSVTPLAMADLEPTYRHAAGILELDLSRLQLPAGQTPLHISMGAGKVNVTVPWDAEVEARASVGAGSFDLFGNRQTGVNLKGRTHSTGQPGAPVLVITSRAGAGEIVVQRGFEPYTHEALRSGQPVPLQCVPTGGASMRCRSADGVTQTPALGCVVSESGAALCRPAGEPEPAVDYANDPGTRHCQVPAGGGEATCTTPIPGARKSVGAGAWTCMIPYGGGPAACRPADGGATGNSDPNGPTPPVAPTAPAAPTSPTDPNNPPASPATTAPGPAPGEYRCTVPDGGGPATCQPA